MLFGEDDNNKKENKNFEEDNSHDLDEYTNFDDRIKKIFSDDDETKAKKIDEEDEEEIPQDKEGYKVEPQLLDKEINGLKPANLSKVMKTSFIEYAMSVIVSRALPDARDGLKPVHRRILYGMSELGMFYTAPHKKSARIVGDVLGKYHPHGDSSVYEAMVRMAQDFSLRYPLIDGHGNFGSVDGDEAAAMRYTEARMSKIAGAMVDGIKKNTVDFMDNYDATEKEPVVLPSRFPNLLVSGSSGIAVGMATNIPPHNLGETIDAVCALAKNPEINVFELMEYIQAPDFPTGGIIFNKKGLIEAYSTGRGSITIRSKAHIQELSNGKSKIIVTEIPYEVKKTEIMEKISELIKDKKIDGIADFRDESNRDGIRIVIDIKKSFVPEIVLNNLFKLTKLQSNYSFNMIALVNNEPKLLNLKACLEVYLKHQIEVVSRRLKFDLEKDRARAHILEGLKICIENIDAVIKIIKESKTDQEAQSKLSQAFNLSEIQTKAIVDMKLGRLTGLAIEKMNEELNEVHERIANYIKILGDHNLLINLIIEELQEIKNAYGDARRSDINWDELSSIDNEDLIPKRDIVITLTNNGYIKRLDIEEYREQRRGGVGVSTTKTYKDDAIQDILVANTHTDLLIFTDLAKVYRIRGHEVPVGTKQSKGIPIVNVIPSIQKNEKVIKILPINEYKQNEYLLTATKKGIVKKTPTILFESINRNGKIAFAIRDDDDKLIDALIVKDEDEIFIAAWNNKICRFDSNEIRSMGRMAYGVKGIKIDDVEDNVVSVSSSNQGKYIFSLGKEGYGKLTLAAMFRKTRRGASGVYSLNEEKSGKLIYAATVHGVEDLIVLTSDGVAIRFSLKDVAITGRNTKGVKLVNLKGRTTSIVAATKILDDDLEDNDRKLSENEFKEIESDAKNNLNQKNE